jgi:hypothetical protein
MFGKKKTDSEMLREIYDYEKYLKTSFDERRGELFKIENLSIEDKIYNKLVEMEKKLDDFYKLGMYPQTSDIKLKMPTSTPWGSPSENK